MRSPFRRRGLVAATALALGGALFGAVPAASAETIPGFSFSKCPALPAGADPELWMCNVAVINGGHLDLGSMVQNITSPITLTYAVGFDGETGEQTVLVGALESEKFKVIDGIFGDPFFTAVYAKPEYAGFMDLQGGDILINLKFKLSNPKLGSSCYVGSNGDPIKLRMIFGTTNPPAPNQPISGEFPTEVSLDPLVYKATIVDNSFAVPQARNCGLLGLGSLNWAVDLYAGLPSRAGNSAAVFKQYLHSKTYAEMGS